jgi:hypothetical protein
VEELGGVFKKKRPSGCAPGLIAHTKGARESKSNSNLIIRNSRLLQELPNQFTRVKINAFNFSPG